MIKNIMLSLPASIFLSAIAAVIGLFFAEDPVETFGWCLLFFSFLLSLVDWSKYGDV